MLLIAHCTSWCSMPRSAAAPLDHPRWQAAAGTLGKHARGNAREDNRPQVHMMVMTTIRSSAFGIASAAANTAATLRVPSQCHDASLILFQAKAKAIRDQAHPTMNRVIERRAKLPAVLSIPRP